MSVALALLSAHLLADFPLQSDQMAQGKFDSAETRLQHVGVHWIVTGLFLALVVSPQKAAIGLFSVSIAHFVIDSRRWNIQDGQFDLYPIVEDQSLHITSLFFVSLLL